MWNYDYKSNSHEEKICHFANAAYCKGEVYCNCNCSGPRCSSITRNSSGQIDNIIRWLIFTRLKSYDIIYDMVYCSDCSRSSHQYWRARFITRKLSSKPSVALVHTCSYWWNSPFLGESSLASIKWPRLQQQACDSLDITSACDFY